MKTPFPKKSQEGYVAFLKETATMLNIKHTIKNLTRIAQHFGKQETDAKIEIAGTNIILN